MWISLQLRWLRNFILVAGTAANQNRILQINDIKFYVNVVAQENIKLFKQWESGFKRTTSWKEYLPKATNQAENRSLDYLIDACFQRVNRLNFVIWKC